MKYRHIVSITGLGGLFQLLSTKNNGAFVKSLEDHSNKFISSRTHQVTPLESIEIYTQNDNIYLHEVFEKLKSVDEKIGGLNLKDNAAVIELFAEAVPEFDRERVYTSDIKKIFKWYTLLQKNELLDFTEYFEAAQENTESTEEENTTESKEDEPAEEKKPVKKAKAAKAKAAAQNKEEDKPSEEEKPKAKRASRKKTETDTAEEEAPKPAKKAKAAAPKKKKTEE